MEKLWCSIVLSSVVSTVFGIQCYNCVSEINGTCSTSDLSFERNIVDCTTSPGRSAQQQQRQNSSLDVQACYIVIAKENNVALITRGCSTYEESRQCKEVENYLVKQGVSAYDIACSVCETDKCNSGTTLETVAVLFSLFISSLIFLI